MAAHSYGVRLQPVIGSMVRQLPPDFRAEVAFRLDWVGVLCKRRMQKGAGRRVAHETVGRGLDFARAAVVAAARPVVAPGLPAGAAVRGAANRLKKQKFE